MEITLESRIAHLEQCVANLQYQINYLKNNPIVSVGMQQDFNCCNCTTPQQCYQMNGGWICAGCNRPLHRLPLQAASTGT